MSTAIGRPANVLGKLAELFWRYDAAFDGKGQARQNVADDEEVEGRLDVFQRERMGGFLVRDFHASGADKSLDRRIVPKFDENCE